MSQNKGFSLVELLVTVGLTVVIVGGVGALFIDVSNMQTRMSAETAISQMKARLTTALSESPSWKNTFRLSLNGVLNQAFLCAAQTIPSCVPTPIQANPINYLPFDTIQDGTGPASNPPAPLYGNSIYTDTATSGFSYQGVTCNTFSTVTPDDNCPLGYRLRVQFSCPDPNSCLSPEVSVWGILVYSPKPGGLNLQNLNRDKYLIHVVKGVNTPKNETIQVVEATNGNGPPITSPTCVVGGVSRKFNTVLADSACQTAIGPGNPGCNVLSLNPLVLRAGTYLCYASSEAYGVDGFTLSIHVNNLPLVPKVTSAAAFAPALPSAQNESATISNFKIQSLTNFNLELIQRCQIPGTAPFALGVPLSLGGVYNSNIYSGLFCTRIL